jgi:hypothetical protein
LLGASLLGLQADGWWIGYLQLQRQVHSLMGSILIGLSWINKIHFNAQ